jgi:uncharacterized protein (TIGR02145 family)
MKKLFFILAFAMSSVFIINGQTIVKIGDQKWAVKNLNVTTFRNGDTLIEAKTEKEWKRAIKEKKAAWCYYNNDATNDKKHGKLYNEFAITDPRGLAPIGFHIPTNEDWVKLGESLGGLKEAGLKLKSSADFDGDNSSGFNGMASGIRYAKGPNGFGGTYDNLGIIGYYWSARRDVFFLKIKKNSINKIPSSAGCYLSVRCIAE